MGAWGYGPFDNDDAGDWLLKVDDVAYAPLKRAADYGESYIESGKVDPQRWNEAYASAAIVVALGEHGQYDRRYAELYAVAERALENMLMDADFVSSWKQPKKFIATVSEYIDKLDRWKNTANARRRKAQR